MAEKFIYITPIGAADGTVGIKIEADGREGTVSLGETWFDLSEYTQLVADLTGNEFELQLLSKDGELIA